MPKGRNDDNHQEKLLIRQRDRHEAVAKVFAWLIVIGLGVELLLSIREAKPLYEVLQSLSGTILVLIGVGGEIIFGARSGKAAESLRHISEISVAEANARAAEAMLALERLKAPRRLSAEQEQEFVSKLAFFAPEGIYIKVVHGDEETDALAQQIWKALQSAGWNPHQAMVRGWFPDAMSGLLLTVIAGANAEHVIAANAIENALRSFGLRVSRIAPLSIGNPTSFVALGIGRKP